MERHLIVYEPELRRLQLFRKYWLAGWIAGALVTVGGAFAVGRAVAYGQAMDEVAAAHQEIERLTEEQRKTTAAFVTAWENQQEGIKLVTSWAQYIKDRDDLIKFNKENGPSWKVAQRTK